MKRATTITGLLWQNLKIRWEGLSTTGRRIVVVGGALLALGTAQMGACAMGACHSGGCPLAEARAAEQAAAPVVVDAVAADEAGSSCSHSR